MSSLTITRPPTSANGHVAVLALQGLQHFGVVLSFNYIERAVYNTRTNQFQIQAFFIQLFIVDVHTEQRRFGVAQLHLYWHGRSGRGALSISRMFGFFVVWILRVVAVDGGGGCLTHQERQRVHRRPQPGRVCCFHAQRVQRAIERVLGHIRVRLE